VPTRKTKERVYRVYYRLKDGSLDSLNYRGNSKEEAAKHFRHKGYRVVKVKRTTQL